MTVPAVQFEGVSKRFRRGQLHDSLRDWIGAATGWLRRSDARTRSASTFWALRDVSFAASPGEALGIIGPNGAGKSTSLKLLARILRPDGGSIQIRGRVAALIEVSAGMHGDLTGRENIYLNGAIMGMNRGEVDRKLDAIVAFSGLENFLDTPVKRYSTGMTARLGFSVAAHVDPDILLVDEVLSVGDVAFRQRCEARMRKLVERGTTLIFVTHNLEQMRTICHRTVVLDGGRVTYAGDPIQAVEEYMRATMNVGVGQSYADCPRDVETVGDVLNLIIRNQQGREIGTVYSDQTVDVEIAFRLRQPVARLCVETTVRSLGGNLWVNFNSEREGRTYDAPAGAGRVQVRLPSLPLVAGNYLARVRMWDTDRCQLVAETPARFPLHVDDRGKITGMLALPNHWSPRVESIDTGCDEVDDHPVADVPPLQPA